MVRKKGENQYYKKVVPGTDVGGMVLEKPAHLLQGFDTTNKDNQEGHGTMVVKVSQMSVKKGGLKIKVMVMIDERTIPEHGRIRDGAGIGSNSKLNLKRVLENMSKSGVNLRLFAIAKTQENTVSNFNSSPVGIESLETSMILEHGSNKWM